MRFSGLVRCLVGLWLGWCTGGHVRSTWAGEVDVSQYDRACRVTCKVHGQEVVLRWPLGDPEGMEGYLCVSADERDAPIRALGWADRRQTTVLLEDQEPVYFLTVGTRQMPPGKPVWQKWFTFFDNPAQRPHQTYRTEWEERYVKVISHHDRVLVDLGRCRAGPFRGRMVIELFAGSDLVSFQARLKTDEDDRAILYDAALAGPIEPARHVVWKDTEDHWRRAPLDRPGEARPLAVRSRTIVMESTGGSVAFFPPPHQYFFPRDLTTNLRYVWYGTGYQQLEPRHAVGIRMEKTGGGSWVPWCNAPPGTEQRLTLFAVVSPADGQKTWDRALRYTHHDRFPELPGYVTFTSHYHMAVAVSEMEAQRQGRGGRMPEFVDVFKRMGVQIVHLAEFHGDGHPQDPGPLRLPELQMMFSECRRLSDPSLLLLPGEEANRHLGVNEPGKHPGHWMCLFPRPVYWTMVRNEEQPYVEMDSRYGRVYHVGSRAEMMRLLVEEKGLAWVAHPRIKASSWTPDIFRNEDFYLADFFLGAAWKAMPTDLSQDRLGVRALDLLDDMANWGQRKYLVGEVDVFKIDHTHELYGHMNINYLRLDRLPEFDKGWPEVLDVLRSGKFFVSTGEVLIEEFQVDGATGGDQLRLPADGRVKLRLGVRWTFPPGFVLVSSGDGQRVYHERLDMSHEAPFSRTAIEKTLDLTGRKWVRVEAWDVAVNGAFSQPVWLVE
ncbi:MAG: hypothetical protein KatS3mg110_3724 [Pirellulaceae bacterium]|nr:MAG: hypothetical protein KatS3mg110_3724 [Pirellulaceae bacterium]